MKYGLKEVSELTGLEILAAYKSMCDIEIKRNEASKNLKFDKSTAKGMDFPSVNPAFIELKNEILTEIKNRKLEI